MGQISKKTNTKRSKPTARLKIITPSNWVVEQNVAGLLKSGQLAISNAMQTNSSTQSDHWPSYFFFMFQKWIARWRLLVADILQFSLVEWNSFCVTWWTLSSSNHSQSDLASHLEWYSDQSCESKRKVSPSPPICLFEFPLSLNGPSAMKPSNEIWAIWMLNTNKSTLAYPPLYPRAIHYLKMHRSPPI